MKAAADADAVLLVLGDQTTVSTDPDFAGQYYREVATVGEHFDVVIETCIIRIPLTW